MANRDSITALPIGMPSPSRMPPCLGPSPGCVGPISSGEPEDIIGENGLLKRLTKAVLTTNAVESLNMSLRKIIKTRGSFPNEESAVRLMWLALTNHAKKWSFVQGWRDALNRFQILWPERMPKLERN